jgi:hypothetical protein
MKLAVSIGALVIPIFLSSVSAQQGNTAAPLGLEWGANLASTKARGVETGDESDSNFGKSVAFTKLPQVLADQETAIGFYGYDDRLYRLVIISKQFSNDPFGNAAISRYAALSELLTEKYGKPTQNHRLGDSIYAEPRYFVSGIQGGRTSWYSNFKSQDLFVQLGIIADDSSTARWRIIYENNALRGQFDKSKRVKEKGAL